LSLGNPKRRLSSTIISLLGQLSVEPFLADARFIARHEQDSLAFSIECKGYSPFAIRCAEAQLLHARMTAPFFNFQMIISRNG